VSSTALVVPEKGVYAGISDIIQELALEDIEAGLGESAWSPRPITPRRATVALLGLERVRMLTHPPADIHQAFALLVPEHNR